MALNRRKTIMNNPLDEVEQIFSENNLPTKVVRLVKEKNSKKSDTPKGQTQSKKSQKNKKDAKNSIAENVDLSQKDSAKHNGNNSKLRLLNANKANNVDPEDVFLNEECIEKVSNSLHPEFPAQILIKENAVKAEDIFAQESGSRNLVVYKNNPDLRHHRANKRVLFWSWVSVPTALIPIALLDVAASIAIQIKMIKEICALYNIPFKNENARAFISGLIGGGVASIASTGLQKVLIKSLPHVGGTIAFLAQPALGFSTTYALGQVFIKHIENDGVLTDFDSEKMREIFREQIDKGKLIFKRGRQNSSVNSGMK